MIKGTIDAGSVVVIGGTLLGYLPAIAAIWSIAWFSIQIYESKTVQDWVTRDKTSQGEQVDDEDK
jgi:hypothetical protein